MRITSTLIRKAVAVYLILGGVFCLFFFIWSLGILGYLNNIVPAAFATLLLLYYIICGVYYLRSNGTEFSVDLMNVALMMQAIQFLFFGISYSSYFGPYLGLGLVFDSSFDLFFKFHLFNFNLSNGISEVADTLYFSINFLPIATLLLIEYLAIHEKKAGNERLMGLLQNDQLENN